MTFMYEEDRQHALTAYSEMFEEAEDEQALLQALVSPLRQAVEVARAYNAGKPALNEANGKKPDTQEEEDDNHFAYLDTIYRIRAEALSHQPSPAAEPVDKDQISLFDENSPEETEETNAATLLTPTEAAAVEAPVQAAGEAPGAAVPDIIGEAGAQGDPVPVAPQPEDESLDAAVEEIAAVVDRVVDEQGEEASASDEPQAAADGSDADEAGEDDADESGDEPAAPVKNAPAPFHEDIPERLPVMKGVRKPRVPLLILYILLAVPLTLIGIVLLLVPALACLVAALSAGTLAVLTIIAALGSFPKLANLLVALGAALILLAFALLMLMLFIWLIGGAISGLVRGVIALGGKCCYKEVADE